MLTNFFGKSKPVTFLVTFILFFCLYFTAFFCGKINANYTESFFIFLFLLGVVVFINSKNHLSFDNVYVILIFIGLLGFFPKVLGVEKVSYTNLFLLFYLRKTYSLQSSNQLFKKLFDAGFWLGISFVLEPFSIVFGLLVFLSTYLHQHLTARTITIPILGFFVPVFLYFTYCFWFDKTELFIDVFDWYTYYDLDFYQDFRFLIPMVTLLFFVFIGVFVKTPRALSVKNDFRRSWILIVFNLICAIALVIFIEERNGNEVLYMFFPMALIIANLIEVYENRWFSDVFIAFFIVFSFTLCVV